jgi:DNA-directed RNA polymerase subunit H (RpoH/RPB5)
VCVDKLSKMHARDPTARHLFARPGEVIGVRWSDRDDHVQLKHVVAARSN